MAKVHPRTNAAPSGARGNGRLQALLLGAAAMMFAFACLALVMAGFGPGLAAPLASASPTSAPPATATATQTPSHTHTPRPDTDGDRLPDDVDPCPGLASTVENDLDQDGWGDSCDEDVDGDALVNAGDDCLFDAGQACLGAPPVAVHLVNTEVLTRQAAARVAYAGLSFFEHPDPAYPALLNGVLYAVDEQPLWDAAGDLRLTLTFAAAASAPAWSSAGGSLSLSGGVLRLDCPAAEGGQCAGRLTLDLLLDGAPLAGPVTCAVSDLRCAWSVNAALAGDGLVNAWGAFDAERNEVRFTAALPAFPGDARAAEYRLETHLAGGTVATLLSESQAFAVPYRLEDAADDCAQPDGQPAACQPYADLRAVTIEPVLVDGQPFIEVTMEMAGDIPLDRVGDYMLPDVAQVVEIETGQLRAQFFDGYPDDAGGPWQLRGFMENDARQMAPMAELPAGLSLTVEANRAIWRLPLGLAAPRTQALWYVGTRTILATASTAPAGGRLSRVVFQNNVPLRDAARDGGFRSPPLAFFPPAAEAGRLPQVFYPLYPDFDLPVHLYGVIPFVGDVEAIVRASCGVVVPAGPEEAVWLYRGDCGQEAEFVSGDGQVVGVDQPSPERSSPPDPAAPQPASKAPPPAQQVPRETPPPPATASPTPTATRTPIALDGPEPTRTEGPSPTPTETSAVPVGDNGAVTPEFGLVITGTNGGGASVVATRTPSPEDNIRDALGRPEMLPWLILSGLFTLAGMVLVVVWLSVRRGYPVPELNINPPGEPGSVPVPSPLLRPPPLCPVLNVEGAFEPCQGTWQDDYDWADRPTKQLTRETSTSYHAELDMVRGRDTLLFGIRDSEHNTIIFRGQTTGTQWVDVMPVFTLYEKGAAPRVIWEGFPVYRLKLRGPCGPPEEFLIEIDARNGQPEFAPPFTFDNTGRYRIEGELLLPNRAPTGIMVMVRGEVIETYAPLVILVPTLLFTPTATELAVLLAKAAALAAGSQLEIPDFFPLAPGKLRVICGPVLDLTKAVLLAEAGGIFSSLVQVSPVDVVHGVRRTALLATVTLLAGVGALAAGADRVVVVLRSSDYDLIDVGGLRSNGLATSSKVVMVRDIVKTHTVAHELLHTLPYVYADEQMVEICGRSYHNDKGSLEANGHRILNYGREARERMRSVASIMNHSWYGPPTWINQISYWHLLAQLQEQPDPRVILVQGLLARADDGEALGQLGPAYQLDGRVDLEPGAEGEWAIVLRAAAGDELGRYPLKPVWWLPDAEVERNLIGFTYRVPDVPGVAVIELVGPGGLLDRRVYSAHAPTLRILSPAAGASVPAGTLGVEWEGADADGDNLTYSVFYSADGGATWQIEALEQDAARLDIAVVGGPGPHLVRVLASDGARSAEAIVSFTVA